MAILKAKIIFALSLFFSLFLISNNALAQTSTDAIGFRIIKNIEHHSAMRWYQEQDFTGSPQSLMVDGYEAVRDGRTVYVNAANIHTDEDLYTNIYLISYNQGSEKETEGIFSQILMHWKFNTNVGGSGDCIKPDGKKAENCSLDEDCNIGEYCDSKKAKIRRDVRRMADLADMKTILEKSKDMSGHYPLLGAGTYLSEKTISTWPSWEETLAKELNSPIPKDPINRMGKCAGFDPETCWNEDTKTFADADSETPAIDLPADSKAYAYASTDSGRTYTLCAQMETGYASVTDSDCQEEFFANQAPIISCNTMTGSIGKEFRGTVSAYDPDGGELVWDMTTVWSAGPVLISGSSNSQKVVYASQAGAIGSYSVNIIVEDERKEKTEQACPINIVNMAPVIMNNPCYYLFDQNKPGEYKIRAVDPDGHTTSVSMTGSLPSGLTFNSSASKISGTPNVKGKSIVKFTATDQYGLSSSQIDCSIRVGCHPDCSCAAEVCSNETCVDVKCGGICNGRKDCAPDPSQPPVCDNGICEAGETCNTCPDDCGECPLLNLACNTTCTIHGDYSECLSGFCDPSSKKCRNPLCDADTDCVCKECNEICAKPNECRSEYCDLTLKICRNHGCSSETDCDCTPPCSCSYIDQGCGEGGCAPNEMFQKNTCNRPECGGGETKCNPAGCDLCGNGTKDSGEECDDGNKNDKDGCSNTCKKPSTCDAVCVASIGCTGYDCPDSHCRKHDCLSDPTCSCGKPNTCNAPCTLTIGCETPFICHDNFCRYANCVDDTKCECFCKFNESKFNQCYFK